MKKIIFCLVLVFLGLFFACPTFAFFEENYSSLLSGEIVFVPNSFNNFWYVNPQDFHRYPIGNKEDANKVFKSLSLEMSDYEFEKLSESEIKSLAGKFIIKPKGSDNVFYVTGNSILNIKDYNSVNFLFRIFSTSASESVLKDIPLAKIVLDDSGKETSRTWQYLGFWGKVNAKYAPALSEPKVKSKKIGAYSTKNRLKVLAIIKNEEGVWYQLDGGLHPGAYVEAKFIDPIPQPTPEKETLVSRPIKDDEYWIDVDVSKEVLTLFKGRESVFVTYVSTGVDESPTIIGTFSVRYKIKKTRMHGAPPLATHYYDLKDVPWTMYYQDSYAIHGAYWHDEFGIKRSAGCTNLSIGDAKFVFDLSKPVGDADKIKFSKDNPGTVINNHY